MFIEDDHGQSVEFKIGKLYEFEGENGIEYGILDCVKIDVQGIVLVLLTEKWYQYIRPRKTNIYDCNYSTLTLSTYASFITRITKAYGCSVDDDDYNVDNTAFMQLVLQNIIDDNIEELKEDD